MRKLRCRANRARAAFARHLFRVHQSLEFNVFGLGRGLETLDEIGKGKSHPGHDHRPCLHTAHPVDALLQWVRFQEVIQGKRTWGLALTADDHRPRPSLNFCAFSDGRFVGAELVVIVISRNILEGVWGIGNAVLRIMGVRERSAGRSLSLRGAREAAQARSGGKSQAAASRVRLERYFS